MESLKKKLQKASDVYGWQLAVGITSKGVVASTDNPNIKYEVEDWAVQNKVEDHVQVRLIKYEAR